MMRIEWLSGTHFEAARRMSPNAPHHGHSFKVNARGVGLDADTLRHALTDICGVWDYQDLSAVFQQPDDATIVTAIANGLHERLGVAHAVALRSAPHCGVEFASDGQLLRWLSADFSAAHFLPNVPDGHQCGRLHGHGFKVRLCATIELSATALAQAWQPLYDTLHNRYLNQIDGLDNPTSEVLSDWLWQRLRAVSPHITAVEVFETRTAGSRRDASGYTIWKEQCFEAAVPLDEHGNYTGHSYLARLHLHGTPDAHAGWLRDFADVKAVFKPIYAQLDHHAIDAIAGIRRYDCANVAQWIAAQIAPKLPELSRVEIFENDCDGARWSAV